MAVSCCTTRQNDSIRLRFSNPAITDLPPTCTSVTLSRTNSAQGACHGDTTRRNPVARQTIHRRRDRRLGQKHAARSAAQMAGERRPPGGFHRVELVAAGAPDDAARQARAVAHPAHLQPDPRRRPGRPHGAAGDPRAQGRRYRPGRPLHLHRVRAGRRARAECQVGAQAVQLRGAADRVVLLQGAAGRGAAPHPGGPARAEVVRGGHGPRPEPRPLRVLPPVPEADPGSVRGHDRRVRPDRDRRHAAARSAAAADACADDAPSQGRDARRTCCRGARCWQKRASTGVT